MKKIRMLLLLSLLGSCYPVERNCLPFHNGRFRFTTEVNGSLQTAEFIRKDNLEIEFYQQQTDSANIRWVNDCECILTKINPTSNQDKRPIRMRILQTKDSSEYVFEYSLVGDNKNTKRGTIEKLN